MSKKRNPGRRSRPPTTRKPRSLHEQIVREINSLPAEDRPRATRMAELNPIVAMAQHYRDLCRTIFDEAASFDKLCPVVDEDAEEAEQSAEQIAKGYLIDAQNALLVALEDLREVTDPDWQAPAILSPVQPPIDLTPGSAVAGRA